MAEKHERDDHSSTDWALKRSMRVDLLLCLFPPRGYSIFDGEVPCNEDTSTRGARKSSSKVVADQLRRLRV
jgi:hypothetical protein